MGSSSSRLGLGSRGPPPPPPPPPWLHRTTRPTLSSLFLCGASTSHTPTEMEDDPAELLMNYAEQRDPVVNNFKSSTVESALASGTGCQCTSARLENETSSDSSMLSSEDSSSQDGSSKIETNSNQGKYLSGSKELVFPYQLSADYSNTSSALHEDRSSSVPIAVNRMTNMDVVNGIDSTMTRPTSHICAVVTSPCRPSSHGLGDSSSDGVSVENYGSEVVANYTSGSSSAVSNSPVSFHSPRNDNDTIQDTLPSGLGFLVSERDQGPRDGSVVHVDVVSISSNILPSSSAEINNREARRNSRRLFWDAFSRRGSRRQSDSQTFIFSTDASDDLGTHDRWLPDFSGDSVDDGIGGDSGYLGSRTHNTSEPRWHSRSQLWERLRGGLDDSDRRTAVCPSGHHPDGTCSCESVFMAEESGTRASISRIVMLAEALFEVLDEIHRQPVSLSLSVVSLPARESVVDSFPVKNHRKPEAHEMGDDVEQCYICLAEYEEGDKIRILPCHHEYHKSCVDKWLKEIHGVCPLCRGDVSEGFPDGSISNSEIPSI